MNWKKILYCFLINCVIILISGELFLRFFIPQLTYSRFLQLAGNYYAPSESNTYTLQKNFKGVQLSQEFPGRLVKTTTNSLGLRGKEITLEKPSGYKRILVLGDSFTFGLYVSDEETYPAVLEKLLTGQGHKVEVINAGYADGFETDDIYCWLVNYSKTTGNPL